MVYKNVRWPQNKNRVYIIQISGEKKNLKSLLQMQKT